MKGRSLLEQGCHLCALTNEASLGEIQVSTLNLSVTVDHVCNATATSFIDHIKQRLNTECALGFKTLIVKHFWVSDFKEAARVTQHFEGISVGVIHTSLRAFYLFVQACGFSENNQVSYTDDGTVCFKEIESTKDLFWIGWYTDCNVRAIDIGVLRLKSALSPPPPALCVEMQHIRSLSISAIEYWNCDAFLSDIQLSIRRILMAFAPRLEYLQYSGDTLLSMRMVFSALGIVGENGAYWPHLEQLDFWQTNFREGDIDISCLPTSMMRYVEHVPNLHTVNVNGYAVRLKCVDLGAVVSVWPDLLPEVQHQLARVRYRTHMAAHVYVYLRADLNRDLARSITQRYVAHFDYPHTAPTEFLYKGNDVPIDEVNYQHLYHMYAQCTGTKANAEIKLLQDKHERMQEMLEKARVDARVAKAAFDAKIVGKRKRLHNAVCKARRDVERYEVMLERNANRQHALQELQTYSREAGKAYFERYVRELFKIPQGVLLNVADKWMQEATQ